jgi:hypothetical protein
LEFLDTRRSEVNVGLLGALSSALSDRTAQLHPDALSHLIQISYPYVAFDELRPTVFEAMRGHESIPPRVLDLLLADPYLKTHRPDILSSLAPIQVRQQLWARDPKGAYASMLSLICRRFHNELPTLNHQILFEAASSFRQSLIHLMGASADEATGAPHRPEQATKVICSRFPMQYRAHSSGWAPRWMPRLNGRRPSESCHLCHLFFPDVSSCVENVALPLHVCTSYLTIWEPQRPSTLLRWSGSVSNPRIWPMCAVMF